MDLTGWSTALSQGPPHLWTCFLLLTRWHRSHLTWHDSIGSSKARSRCVWPRFPGSTHVSRRSSKKPVGAITGIWSLFERAAVVMVPQTGVDCVVQVTSVRICGMVGG